MTPERFRAAERIFRGAVQRSGGERAAYVRDTCAGDEELRDAVEDLLRVDAAPPPYLADEDLRGAAAKRAASGLAGETVPPVPAASATGRRPGFPERIGAYRVVRPIASGGMATVFEAVQDRPQRPVALKLLRPSIFTDELLRRFELESQLLARLRHPGIAEIYEAGAWDDGGGPVPFFAMEYVPEARTICEHADAVGLGTRGRVELFLEACDAVQHGHGRGVIHRDLKPANILVGDDGRVKVIDFGVARMAVAGAAATRARTQAGQIIGTLQYMSPEQTGAGGGDVDIRADVYALGAVLYELLTGRVAYDLDERPVHEALRVIREERPRRPRAIRSDLPRDLDTIAMKALEKDRDRRYDGVAALATDLRRFLRGEPVSARGDSTWYVLRRWTARRRVGVAASAAIILLAATALTAWVRGLVASERQRYLEAVNLLLIDEAHVVDPFNVRAPTPQQLTWAENGLGIVRLDRANELRVRKILGEASLKISDNDRAARHFERALELATILKPPPDAGVARAQHDLARVRFNQSRFAESMALYERALEISEALPDGDQADFAANLNGVAACLKKQGRYVEAEPRYRAALAMYRRLGDRRGEAAQTNNLATLARERGRFAEAEDLYRAALKELELTGEGARFMLRGRCSLAQCILAEGRTEEAGAELERVLEETLALFGPDHADVAGCLQALAEWHVAAGDMTEAERLARESLRIRAERFRRPHEAIAEAMVTLARALMGQGRNDDAESLLEQAAVDRAARLGEGHPDFAETLTLRARLALDRGDRAAALSMTTAALGIQERLLDPAHPGIAETRDVVAAIGDAAVAPRRAGAEQEDE